MRNSYNDIMTFTENILSTCTANGAIAVLRAKKPARFLGEKSVFLVFFESYVCQIDVMQVETGKLGAFTWVSNQWSFGNHLSVYKHGYYQKWGSVSRHLYMTQLGRDLLIEDWVVRWGNEAVLHATDRDFSEKMLAFALASGDAKGDSNANHLKHDNVYNIYRALVASMVTITTPDVEKMFGYLKDDHMEMKRMAVQRTGTTVQCQRCSKVFIE